MTVCTTEQNKQQINEEAPVGLNQSSASQSLVESVNEITTVHENSSVADLSKESVSTTLLSSTPSDVENFLRRPLIIASLDEAFLADGLIHQVNLNSFFLNDLMLSKLRGFNYLKADFKVRINITAPAYAYGAIAVSYGYQDISNITNVVDPVVYMTSRNKEYIDLSQNQTLEMTIPFCHPYDYYDISDLRYTNLIQTNVFPTLIMARMTPLLNALDGSDATYRMTIYTWLDNISLAVPNLFNTESSKEKKEVKKTGQISTVATAFEKGLSAISTVPVVGPVAATGAMIAKSVGSIASAFGFSKPKDPDPHTTIGYTPFAISQGADQVRPLAIDPNNTTDMTMYNDIDGDSLSLQNLLCRSGAITSGQITQDSNISIPVTPFLVTNSAGTTGSPTQRTNLCPLSAMALTHRYWTGSIIYTFRIFASKYHRGRIRISWAPRTTVYNDSDVAIRTQNTLIEIDGSTTVDIEVGWGHAQPYLPVYSCNIASPTDGKNNGYLMYAAMEPFVAPSSTAPVYVIVEMRAGADFDLMEPTINFLQFLHRFPIASVATGTNKLGDTQPSTTIPANINNLLNTPTIHVQGYLESGSLDTNVAVHNTVVHKFNQQAHMVPPKYHGERTTSFRNLLKRKEPTQVLCPGNDYDGYNQSFVTAFPLGRSPISANSSNEGRYWPNTLPNHIEYIGRFFRGWHGSMRVSLISRIAAVDKPITEISVVRAIDKPLTSRQVSYFPGAEDIIDRAENYQQVYYRFGDGVEVFRDESGQVTSFEIPWKLPYNWITRQSQTRAEYFYHGAYISFPETNYPIACHSIGEDFNFTQFLGVPTMYVMGTPFTG
jgi:hypothetical protein